MKRLALGLILLIVAAALLIGIGSKRVASSGPSGPIALYGLPGQSRFPIAGHIEERLLAGSYVYLRIRDALGASHWVVTLRDAAPSREDVEATVYGRAETFYSRRLRRSFSPLWFAAVRAAVPSTTSTFSKKKELP